MKVLISIASKHGATGEIGDILAAVLGSAGIEVEERRPQDVVSIDSYDAVILGSAVYAGRWLEPARAFGERLAGELSTRPVWLFSSGPLGDPPMPVAESPDALALSERIGAREHRTLAGRLQRVELGFLERAITRAVRAPDGDFRDWVAIRNWAGEIARSLTKEEAAA
jgi:menaquinone-dependent protoporphyrinogen oxidase